MSVTVKFSCGGCFAEAESTTFLRREFRGVTGKPWGFGRWVNANSIEDVTPTGWVAFDPWTQCCYCPDCYAEILSEQEMPKGSARATA